MYGMESWGVAQYIDIVSPEKIVYKDYFSDAEGNLAENMPAPEVTLTFADLGGKTKVVNKTVYPTADDVKSVVDMGLQEGFTQTWDRLAEYVVQAAQ